MRIPLLLFVFSIFFSASCVDEAPGGSQASNPAPSRLAALLGEDEALPFPLVTEPRVFVFPQDHGPHPEYRNEWWYLTGNLDAGSGERFGFEVTFFRFALSPTAITSRSAWRGRQLYMGHFAVTDVVGDRFIVEERLARDALGLAGAETPPLRVWLEDWEFTRGPDDEAFRLRAASSEVTLELELISRKSPILNGVDGLSQKSVDDGNASYYFSLTSLDTSGRLTIAGDEFEVTGRSWLDREWGSSALAAEQQGWDWFALQFSDDTELMFYNLRLSDGRADAYSAGTFVREDGSTLSLAVDDVDVEVIDHWDSPRGGRYPSRWRLTVPSLDLYVDVVPVMENQELATSVRYWEGAVDVRGESRGTPLSGRGYVELTGYASSPQGADVSEGAVR